MPKHIGSIAVILNLLVIVRSEPPSTSYGSPVSPPISSYGTPNYHADGGGDQHGNQYNNEEPKSYEFGYQVKDDYTGTNYNQKESSDGNQVRGEYRVALPDGRIQIVTYWADWQTGYHADVRYEGEAHFPEVYNKGGGFGDGGYGNGGAGTNFGGYSVGPDSINNLANNQNGYNNYDSYNGGHGAKAPSNLYGAV